MNANRETTSAPHGCAEAFELVSAQSLVLVGVVFSSDAVESTPLANEG